MGGFCLIISEIKLSDDKQHTLRATKQFPEGLVHRFYFSNEWCAKVSKCFNNLMKKKNRTAVLLALEAKG